MTVKIGGFDEALPARQDWDFWIRITSMGLGLQVPLYTVNKYTMRHDQISFGIKNKLKGTEILYKKHKKQFFLEPIAHQRILRSLGLMSLLNYNNIKAIKYFEESYQYTRKLNKKLKGYGAKATLFKESLEGDILEIKIGNEFCHTGIAYYSPYFLDYTIKEVIMKKLKDNNDTGIQRDY